MHTFPSCLSHHLAGKCHLMTYYNLPSMIIDIFNLLGDAGSSVVGARVGRDDASVVGIIVVGASGVGDGTAAVDASVGDDGAMVVNASIVLDLSLIITAVLLVVVSDGT